SHTRSLHPTYFFLQRAAPSHAPPSFPTRRSSDLPGQTAEVAREAEEALVVLAPLPTEAEQLVDRALELEGLLAALLVVDGEAPQPVGAHLHVGDLIGQHPVLAQRHDRVAAFHAELAHGVEH